MNRKKLLLSVAGAFAAGAIAYGAYWSIALRNAESTDDAYVNGNVVQITSQVPGTVVSIAADDTDFVKAGTTLVQLDTADARVALDEAESQLAKTVRQVRNLYATSGQLAATVRQHDAELARASDDLSRREKLAASGFISNEALQQIRDLVAYLMSDRQVEAVEVDVREEPDQPQVEQDVSGAVASPDYEAGRGLLGATEAVEAADDEHAEEDAHRRVGEQGADGGQDGAQVSRPLVREIAEQG